MKLSKKDLSLFAFITGWYLKGIDLTSKFKISKELKPYIRELKGKKKKSKYTKKCIEWCQSNMKVLDNLKKRK